MRGRLIKGVGGLYYALDENGDVQSLRAQGKLRRDHNKPLVGDIVELTKGEGEEDGWILSIVPRKNSLVRPPVANIDAVLIAVSATAPKPDLSMVDRLMINARMAGITVRMAITKADLDYDYAKEIANQYANADCDPTIVCSRTGEGIETLRKKMNGTVFALAGQSGAGKSTLINALYGLELETGDISHKIERGKNTTRHCELIPVEGGGMVLDTPGFSLLETPLIEPEKIIDYYPEFEGDFEECYFKPCLHAHEPRCGVINAVKEGRINAERHLRYVEILDEMKIRWRDRYD